MLRKAGDGRALGDVAARLHKASAHRGTPLVTLGCGRVDLAKPELRIWISQFRGTERTLRAFLLHVSFRALYVQ